MSIKKIAQMVGVSPSTVSRVLNNPHYHTSLDDLRERIWKAAMDIHYVPNEAARRLKQGAAQEGIRYVNVLTTRIEDISMDPFFREILENIETEIHSQLCALAKIWNQPSGVFAAFQFRGEGICRHHKKIRDRGL